MEIKYLPKFKLYDEFAYLLVGSIALLAITYDLFLLEWPLRPPAFTAQSFIIYLILAYFAGHVSHAIANIVVKEKKSEFTDAEKDILAEARQRYKLEKHSDHDIYLVCYLVSTAKDLTGQVELFNAYYSLYRGWFVIFAIESAYLLVLNIARPVTMAFLVSFFVSAVFAILFFRRSRRFFKYSQTKTLQNYILIKGE